MPTSAEQDAEIAELRVAAAPTLRATVPALEAMLYRAVPVLDHGFIRVVDYMGDDAAVVQAARVSYGRGTKRVSEDAGLIRYLMRHRHSTPFEMCEIKYHVKLPIFVARQWIRHRTANVNEYSARYSVMDREFYIPAPEHLAAQSSDNRQGRGAVLQGAEAASVLDMLRDDAGRAHDNYAWMLNEADADPARQGLARELARMNLTLNTYTQWYWKTDLHNLLGFLSLRADAHAQYEIRAYADAMLATVEAWVPTCCAAFRDYRLGAVTLSAGMLAVLRRRLAGGGGRAGRKRPQQARMVGAGGGARMILVFGSINLDLIYALDELPTPGRTVIGSTAEAQPGGKGANQAVAAARDGASVALAGAVGHDAVAEAATAGLLAAGVDLSRVIRVDERTGTAAICVDRRGQNQIAVARGANAHARADQVDESDLGPGTTLVLQMEVDPAETAALIRRARLRGRAHHPQPRARIADRRRCPEHGGLADGERGRIGLAGRAYRRCRRCGVVGGRARGRRDPDPWRARVRTGQRGSLPTATRNPA